MPFFLIIPVWLLCLLGGLILVCFEKFRRTGIYTIVVSSMATIVSFLLSTGVIYFGPRVVPHRFERWSALLIIGTYVAAIIAGGAIGAVTGFLLVRRMLPRK